MLESRRKVQDTLLNLVSGGATKAAACRQLNIQCRTVTRWVERDPLFAARWRVARIEQAHALADAALAIAEEPAADIAAVQRNRLRVDTIKWLVSKIAPRLYGDRVLTDPSTVPGVIVLPALKDTPAAVNPMTPTNISGDVALPQYHDGLYMKRIPAPFASFQDETESDLDDAR